MITKYERDRYSRQIAISGFGEEGQEKLKHARVAIVGMGGLGCPVAMYLAAAGIGNLKIVDSGKLELSNLNRQVLYNSLDLEAISKVATAYEKLKELNHEIEVEYVQVKVNQDNVIDIISGSHLVVDALDNFPTRYILNQACIDLNLPLVHGAVEGFSGRVMTIIPGKTPCLMCIYGDHVSDRVPPVMGTTCGVIGSIQATEVIKYVTGVGRLLMKRMLIYNGLGMTFTDVPVERNLKCPQCGNRITKGGRSWLQ